MVKKIGKLQSLLLILIGFFQFSDATIDVAMHITDVNGEPITQAGKGIPFVLEIVVAATDTVKSTPKVAGLHNFQIQDQGLVSTINSSINGNRSTRKIFRYILNAGKEGKFLLGPATIDENGTIISSNKISIIVSSEQKSAQNNEISLQLKSDLNSVVVGQPISLIMRFFPGKSQLIEIDKPRITNGSIEQITGPVSGTEIINEQEIPYLEWRTIWYPDKVGQVIIPSLKGVYKIQKKPSHKNFGFDFFNFFDSGFEQKIVHSNNLTIDINPLPPFNYPVTAVGHFKKLDVATNQEKAKIGEGTVLRLSLMGKGNFNTIQAPELRLPDGLKYYESKNYLDDATNNMQTKIFEYIVQAIKPGSYQIPEQTFYFYDINNNTYKKLTSKPVSLFIETNNHVTNNKPNETENKSNLIPLLDESWQPIEDSKIPFKVFIIFLLVPVLLSVIGLFYPTINRYWFEKNSALKKVRKQLRSAKKQGDATQLYSIFLNFFSDKLQPLIISQENISRYLMQNGLNADELKQWELFFNQCAQMAFLKNDNNINLFDQADRWLLQFSKIF